MSERLSRRTLLLGSGALAVMAACGKSGDKDIEVQDDTDTTVGRAGALSVVQAGFNFQTGIDERVTFALFQGVPAELYNGKDEVRVGFQKPGTKALTELVVAERKSEGIEERPYYVVRHAFDAPGTWGMQAQVAGGKGNLTFEVADPAKLALPGPGQPLPRTQTPTAADTMGVNPICTRSPEPCPFHDRSLDKLLGNGKPTIVLLATPALCQSVTCGPVLDILMAETEAARDRLNIVHVEVFADNTGKTLSPAMGAFNAMNEPIAFFADAQGVVTERFSGAYDRTEARAAVARLLG